MRKRIYLFYSVLFVFCSINLLYGQDNRVCFVNYGKMHVAYNPSNSSLYVLGSMQLRSNSSILQNGITQLGKNFYHDADGNGFTREDGEFVSVGTFRFVNDMDTLRYITTLDSSIDDFNRKDNFIAFPEIEIATSDTIILPPKMGMDAIDIVKSDDATGKILLCSKSYSEVSGVNVYDASLRITGSGTSEELVQAGSVIVEKDLTPYRIEEGGTGAGPLFAFATPFENQRTGYFAGNWVRKMMEGDNLHVDYVYGNKAQGGIIIRDQYICDPEEPFVPGKGYLLRLRKQDYSYDELIKTGGLGITKAEAFDYNKDKLMMCGQLYNLEPATKQLFARDTLFHYELNNAEAKTLNWIIGNSYTCSISIDSLINAMGNSPLKFEPNIYVFPKGSTSYHIYKIQPNNVNNSMNVIDIESIPAMSYFMIRVSKNANQSGSLTLTKKDLLVHDNNPHSYVDKIDESTFSNEVLFKVSPDENSNVYDMAGIALRSNGNKNADGNDIIKVSNSNDELFQLYAVSEDNQKLSANIIPEDMTTTRLNLLPGKAKGTFRIEAQRIQSLSTEGIWIEDLKERKVVDLKESNGIYVFEVNPLDDPNRFKVHFKKVYTNIEEVNDEFWQIYYSDNNLIVEGLTTDDIGSELFVADIQGRILFTQKIHEAPKTSIFLNLNKGIYIAKLEGKRTLSLKFLSK